MRLVFFKSNGQKCAVCTKYTAGKCSVSDQVKRRHGQHLLDQWLVSPTSTNDCDYFIGRGYGSRAQQNKRSG